MLRQKRLAIVNDLTGFGRCSITVELPLVSALKVQACPLPTALLSVHTGFSSYYMDDYTEKMKPYIQNWRDNKLEFDGILTGFLASVKQIEVVLKFIDEFRTDATLVAIDPVMGDHGKLYASYNEAMCAKMRRLLRRADLILPNLTEACQLLGQPYPVGGSLPEDELVAMGKSLQAKGPRQVIITGLTDGNELKNAIFDGDRPPEFYRVKKIGGDRSGTGDAFAAIVTADLLHGEKLSAAVKKGAEFISLALNYAESMSLPWNYGLPFEEFLTELK